jgi:hypothetical protein
MSLSIDLIKQNSGKGSPVFSKRGKQFNTLFSCFNSALPAKIVRAEDPTLDRAQVLKEFKELGYKERFEVSCHLYITVIFSENWQSTRENNNVVNSRKINLRKKFKLKLRRNHLLYLLKRKLTTCWQSKKLSKMPLEELGW